MAIAALAVLTTAFALLPSFAHASKGTVAIWGSTGSGAGQLSFVYTSGVQGAHSAVAVNEASGDVYVLDENRRVSVFDSSGAFQRAWGWGVVASGPDNDPQNEQQTIAVDATGGFFRLDFGASATTQTTLPPIPFDASGAEVQDALESLASLDPGDVSVTGAAGGPWTVDFIGSRADEDLHPIQGWNQTNLCAGKCDTGPPTLTGATATLTISTVVDGGKFEICVPAAGDACQEGNGGTGGIFPTGVGGGLVIDQQTGNVLVGAQKFDSLGNFIGPSGLGGGYLAIDPTSGNIFEADLGNHKVRKFSAAGTLIGAFGAHAEGSDRPADPGFCPGNEDDHLFRDNEPFGIAIGPGGSVFTTHRAQGGEKSGGESNLYTLQPDGFCVGGNNEDARSPFSLKAYSQSGGFLGALAPSGLTGRSPIWVAADPTDDHLYVVHLDGAGGPGNSPPLSWQLAEFDASGQLVDTHATGIPEPLGIAVDGASGRIYAISGAEGDSRIFVLDEVANPPTASISPVTGVSAGGATLHGSVNPGGEPFPGANTGYRFEYRAAGEQAWVSAPFPDADAGAGETAVAVSLPVTGLDPHTTYEVRLVASRKLGAGRAVSASTEFTTTAVPPAITPRSAFPVADTEATLRAVIDAKHSQTAFYFQYGPEDCASNPCTSIPAGQDGDAGSALGPKAVQAEVSGLDPETTYHFRVLAQNPAGAVEGPDRTFTTTSTADAAWPTRGIELVSPPDKGNQQPLAFNRSFPDGFTPVFDDDHIVWSTQSGIPGSVQGSNDVLLSERSEDGWHTHTLLPSIPVQEEQIDDATRFYKSLSVTADFRSTLLLASTFLDGNSDTAPNAIVRREPGGEFTRLFNFSLSAPFRVVYPSRDLSHVFIEATVEDLSGSADPAHIAKTINLYDIGGGTPELVSRMPNGTVPACGIVGGDGIGGGFGGSGYPWASADGSKLFFESTVNKCTGAQRVFMRDLDAGTTTAISPATGSSSFIRANDAGSAVIFSSSGALVAADKNTDVDVYRWDAPATLACLTCVVEDAHVVEGNARNNAVVVSPDLSRVYFVSANQLVPGKGTPGTASLYFVHDGTIDFVAPFISPVDSGVVGSPFGTISIGADSANGAATSSDGKTLLFVSRPAGITPDETGICHQLQGGGGVREEPCPQVYRYEEASESVECVTCLPPGTLHGQRSIGADDKPVSGMSSVAMSADGRTVVFASYVPYLRRDINGSVDLYEWRDGRIRLITDGATEVAESLLVQPRIVGMTPDGSDVFFLSGLRLTGHELDQNMQLYDARSGGGFPPPPIPPAPCVEDACQGPLQSPPGIGGAASAAFAGPGNETAAKPKKKGKARAKCRSAKRTAKQRKKCNGKGHERANANGGRQGR